jgi:NADH:ubiquinone reductase (H+-translocating)
MHVTVVGGGFGGVKAALEIAKDKKHRVTLISNRPDFQYYPALYSTATGGSYRQSWIPLGEIFADYENVDIIIDTITTIDRKTKTIGTALGVNHAYHTLILALGSVTTYFGIPGLDQYSYGVKSLDEITHLKQHLLRSFSKAHGADSHFLIIGAGPTGVELASALGSYLHYLKKKYGHPQPHPTISIIEAAPRVLPRMSEKASTAVTQRLKKLGVHVETNKKVEEETADSLIVSGRAINSHTVIWTSGVANNPFFKANESQFTLAPNGRVIVDEHLRVDKHVYVVGDNAVTAFGGLAQTAIRDGHYVARHLLGKTTKPLNAKVPPVVIPVGKHWAIFEYKNIRITGLLGSLIREAADFVGYKDILPLNKAYVAWRTQQENQEDAWLEEYNSVYANLPKK